MSTIAIHVLFSAALARAPLGLDNHPKPTSLGDALILHTHAMAATHRQMASSPSHVVRASSSTPSWSTRYDGRNTLTSINPTEFGADPSGIKDSTAAMLKAMAMLLNVSSHANVSMASGIQNLGGATLDLDGGEFLISKPLSIPPFIGNVRISGGTLRASNTFPSDKFLIEVGDVSCQPKDHQGVCNEFIAIPNIFLDGSHVAAGGVRVTSTMGTTIGPSAFITGFNVAGVQAEGGHETMILDGWIAEYYWSDKHPNTSCNDTNGMVGSVGVLLNGEDNYVNNVIIFDYTCVGVLVNGAATILDGVHSWNGGGTAILINGTYDVQDRVIACYLDYSVLQVNTPNAITIQDNFFYNSHAVLGGSNIKNTIMRENTYSMNQYGGNQSVVLLDSMATCQGVVIEDDIDGEQGSEPHRIVKTVSEKKLYQKSATKWTFDFSDELLFSTVGSVSYTLILDDEEELVMHAARPPSGTSVVVETSSAVSAMVIVSVTQCSH